MTRAFIFALVAGLVLGAASSTTNAPGFGVYHEATGFEGRALNVLCESEGSCHVDAGYLVIAARPRLYWHFDNGTQDAGAAASAGCMQEVPTGGSAYAARKFNAVGAIDSTTSTGEWILPAVASNFYGSKSSTTLTITDAGSSGVPLEVGMTITGTGWVSACTGSTPWCKITALGTGTGGAGTYTTSCSGNISATTLTGTHLARIIYDGGTPHTFAWTATEALDCHSGLIYVYRWLGKNGSVMRHTVSEAYIPNSNPVVSLSWQGLVTLNRGDYIESFYSIDKTNEHYEAYHHSWILTDAD